MGDLEPGQSLFRNSSEDTKAKLAAMQAQRAAAQAKPVDPMAKALEDAKAQFAASQAGRPAPEAKPADPMAKVLEDAKAQFAASQARKPAPEAKPADPVAQALEEAKARMAAAQARRAAPEAKAAPPAASPFKGSPDETKAKLAAFKAKAAMAKAGQAAGAQTAQSCPGGAPVNLDRMKTASSAPAIHPRVQMHLDMMAECEKQGTRTVVVKTPVGTTYNVKVHAANDKEFAKIENSLKRLGAADKNDLIMRNVQNVYVVDHLPTDKPATVAGRAVKVPSGETRVFLSRMTQATANNKVEKQDHVDHVLYHEIGHVVDNKYNLSSRPGGTFGQGSVEDDDYVSRYAATNHKEDYAESFACYHETRTCEFMKDSSDEEAIQLAAFGKSDKMADKLKQVNDGLSPELHSEQQLASVVQANKAKGATEGAVARKFYDDPQFRQKYVENTTQRYPGATRESVYSHMEKTAIRSGQDPTPGGGALA